MYMLLQIDRETGKYVDGTHLQWCCACSLEEAVKRARATEKANGNRISVAVTDSLYDLNMVFVKSQIDINDKVFRTVSAGSAKPVSARMRPGRDAFSAPTGLRYGGDRRE